MTRPAAAADHAASETTAPNLTAPATAAVARPLSARGRRALDGVNFFLADVRDGLGPFLGIYLVTRGWEAGVVGSAMAIAGLATVAAQSPAGLLVDAVTRRRLLLAVAIALVAAGSAAILFNHRFAVVALSQVVVGVAATLVQPTLAAITLGLVGHAGFDRRVGRSETFNHAGNATAAILTGVLGYFLGIEWIFYLTLALALAGIAAILAIPAGEIDPYLARGATRETCDVDAPTSTTSEADGAFVKADSSAKADVAPLATPPRACKVGMLEVLRDPRILWLAAAVVLFHFANAYMLPLAGQKMASANGSDATPNEAVAFQAGAILAAQAVMTPVALLAGRFAATRGRKPVLLVGFAILPVRGLLYTLGDSPWFLLGVQLLDGVGAGIFGVVAIIMIADLTRGSGRFNAVQGLLFTAVGIGAACSALLTGQIVQRAGTYDAGFLFLAAVAVAACAVLWLKVEESMPADARGRAA